MEELLREVRIVTTSDGPFSEDFFWVLVLGDGSERVFPGTGAGPLLEQLQKLPGFRNEAVIEASCCTDDKTFVAWRAADVDTSAPHA